VKGSTTLVGLKIIDHEKNNKMNSKPISKLASKKKSEPKDKYITTRLTTADRGLVDQAVEEVKTTITDFVSDAALEKARKVITEKQKREMDAAMKYPNDSKFFAGRFINNIQNIKKESELYGGVVGTAILSAIILKQLMK
jgi:hypothetical protein